MCIEVKFNYLVVGCWSLVYYLLMALGRGLQSLIPPQDDASRDEHENHEEIIEEKERVEEHLPVSRYRNIREAIPQLRETYAPEREHPKQESIFQIEVEKIKPNPYQPRREFNTEDLKGLAQSIKEFGVIQPISVSKVTKETDLGTDVEYQLIAGERRLKAAKMVGLERIPAIVKKIDAGKAKLEIALIENIQRSDLNALDSAKAYARLQDEFGLTQREVAARVGKSRESIANTLRLLNLPSEIQDALFNNTINESQARTLLSIGNSEEQKRAFYNIISGKTTMKELREKKENPAADPEGKFWEKKLEEKFQAPVQILKKGGRGKIVIPFYSREEMQALVDKMLGEDTLS